jgi:FKBP-type peptidyl-prolyl cis-trans isomerase FklB
MNSTKEKVSYCIGLETGKNLKRQFLDIDYKLLIDGFQDAVNEATPKLKKEEVQSILTMLRQQVEEQQKDFVGKIASENKKVGEAFLEENKTKKGVKTTASGLQYKVITSGKGACPSLLDEVKVHYKGTFIDGKTFDSSYDRGEPARFPLNRVIPGWSEALQLMKVGDKWQIFVPSYLAYGDLGFGNEIGPNATLIFELELLGIE